MASSRSPSELHREQPDRAGSLHHDGVTGSDSGSTNPVESDRCRFDLRGILVREIRMGVQDPRRGDGDRGGEATVWRGECVPPPCDGGDRPAVLGEATLALGTGPARCGHPDDDPVTLFESLHCGADIADGADPLVAAHRWLV